MGQGIRHGWRRGSQKDRLKLTIKYTENTKEVDATHGESEISTSLEAMASVNQLEELRFIDLTYAMDAKIGNSRQHDTMTAQQDSGAWLNSSITTVQNMHNLTSVYNLSAGMDNDTLP